MHIYTYMELLSTYVPCTHMVPYIAIDAIHTIILSVEAEYVGVYSIATSSCANH